MTGIFAAVIAKMDGRGWFSLALFLLTVAIFALLAFKPDLADDDLFKTLAQAVVLTGLINLAASFYFGASKAAAEPPAARSTLRPLAPPVVEDAPEPPPAKDD